MVFCLVVGGLQWWKYTHFGYNGLDLGIYSQVAWSLTHDHGFASSIHDPTYLGDHLELWLVPISWVYRLFPSPLTLLWIQTLLIALTLMPLARLAHHFLGRRGVIGATVLFVINPLVYNTALYEFHGLVVALPLLVWSIWWYVQQRYWPWLASLAAILLVREDAPFVVVGWATLAIIDRRRWRWWLPTIGLAAVWFFSAQAIIRAANHDGVYKYLAFYRWLGNSYEQILTYPFRHPIIFLQRIVSWDNISTIVGFLVTVGFLPLLRPRALWPLLFLFAQLLIGGAQPWSYLHIHYVVPYLPFLWWGTLVAMRDVLNGKISWRGDTMIPGIIASILVIVAPLYSLAVMGPAEWPWQVRRGQETAANVLRLALADVRPTDRVLTTFNYLPQLANRPSLYSLNYLYTGRRQYTEVPYVVPGDIDVAVIDWQQLYDYQFLYLTTKFEGRSGLRRIQDLLDEQGLSIVRQYGTVAVYRHGGSADRSAAQIPEPLPSVSRQSFGDVSLIGTPAVAVVDQPEFGWRELVVRSDWQAVSTAIDHPLSLRFTLNRGGKMVWESWQIIGQGPHPASEWPVGTVWQTQNILVLPRLPAGQAQLRVDVVIPHGRYRLDRLRMFRPVIDRVEQLGTVDLGALAL